MNAQNLKKVLIANRGEIAIRIAKAAAGLGIESVGVYAPVDAMSLHAQAATASVEIGNKGESIAPYLDIENLVEVAKSMGCDCVHPGYGFLSENATFAEKCAQAGLTFIGPPPSALALFGDKVRSRALAQSLGIPTVPGSRGPLTSAEDAMAVARDLGFPVMLKASAGGGGRGMRLVEKAEDIADAFRQMSQRGRSRVW